MQERTPWIAHAYAELTAAGYRTGGARDEILRMLDDQACCVTAQEIFDALREQRKPVGLASVYRTLEVLADLRLVHRIEIGTAAAYEPAHPGGRHHHHAVCASCAQVIPFEDPTLERFLEVIASRLDFRLDAHDIALRGICTHCRPGPPSVESSRIGSRRSGQS